MTLLAYVVPLLLSLPSPALQEEAGDWKNEDYKEYSLEQLDTGNIPDKVPVFVDCKYVSYLGSVKILACSAKLDVVREEAEEVRHRLAKGDNIRVYGEFIGPVGKKGGTFFVYKIERRPSDAEEFNTRRSTLAAGDYQARLELGDRAKHLHRIYDSWAQGMWQRALEMYEESVSILEKEAAVEDYEAQLGIARILLERMEDRKRALEKLTSACLTLRPEDPDLRSYLTKDVRATFYRDRWVLYEEFKEAEGFVRRETDNGEIWVRKPIARLEAFAEEAENLQVLPGFLETFEENAKSGKVVKGMDKYWVIKAISYPVEALTLPRGKRANWVEIWVYSDRYLFFKGGRLWKEPEPR